MRKIKLWFLKRKLTKIFQKIATMKLDVMGIDMSKTEQEIRIHKKINKEFNKRFPNSDFILYETTVLGTYDVSDGTKELKDFIDNVIDTTIQECQKKFLALIQKWQEKGFELNTLKDHIGTLKIKKEIEEELRINNMADTTLMECKKCGDERDCIQGVCEECFLNPE